MRRSADAGYLVFRHVVRLLEVARDGDVFVGHNAFDGSDHHLVAQAGLQLLEVALDVG